MAGIQASGFGSFLILLQIAHDYRKPLVLCSMFLATSWVWPGLKYLHRPIPQCRVSLSSLVSFHNFCFGISAPLVPTGKAKASVLHLQAQTFSQQAQLLRQWAWQHTPMQSQLVSSFFPSSPSSLPYNTSVPPSQYVRLGLC